MDRNKVLYVDDENVNLFLFEKMFAKHFDVVCAISGPAALEILENDKQIGVVFSDMNMPLMNGIEFIKEAKSSEPEISYLILTAYMVNEEIEKALEDGLILDCIKKPFDREKIVKIVEELTK